MRTSEAMRLLLPPSESVTFVDVVAIPVGLVTTSVNETRVFAVEISTASGVILKETTVGLLGESASAGWANPVINPTNRRTFDNFFIFSLTLA